jgi:hypothetical protein
VLAATSLRAFGPFPPQSGIVIAVATTSRQARLSYNAPSATLYEVRTAAGVWEAYLDNSLHFSTTSNTVAFSNLPQLGKSFGSYFLDGYVAEIGVYNRNISNAERQTIKSYLNTKYGLIIR